MTDYYDPKCLRGVIRNTKPLRTFIRGRFFPEAVYFPGETVSFEYSENTRRLAPYTSPYAMGSAVARDGYTVRTYHTPYVVPKRVITNDTLAMKLLGEAPYNSGLTPEDRAAEIASRDLMELQDMITRREEFMCARAIQDGKLDITGPGVNEVVDYGFTNIKTCTASEKWSSSYDVIGTLKDEALKLRQAGGNPDTLILGSDAASALLENTKILKLMDLRRVDAGEIRPTELEPGVSYIGRLSVPGFMADIYSYDEYYYDDATGSTLPLIDTKTAILLSGREKNSMLYGAVTYIDVKTGEYVTEMSAQVPYTNYRVDPPVKEIYLASRPLPMPKDLNSWSVLKEVA